MTIDAIKNCEPFRGLADSDLRRIEPLVQEKTIEEGRTVFVENMPGEAIYLIERGTIQITKMLAEGDEQTLIVLGPEDIFGETALLAPGPRMATARVVESARLYTITRTAFEAFCERDPALGLKIARAIIEVVIRRMRENDDQYRKMLLLSLDRTGS